MKKLINFLMLIVYSISIFPVNTLALTKNASSSFEELTASKVSIRDNDKVSEYDIKIKVPGKEKTALSGYNFLFVVDASTSTNGTKWNNMRKAIVDVVDVLLPESDSSKNINKVALMTFGIGEHLNVALTSDKEKFNNLPTNAGQSMLLPGRSATNNEVGLSGAYDYLSNLDDSLAKNPNRTYVLYLTDGESNLNEKATNFYDVAHNTYWTLMKRLSFQTLLTFYYYDEVDRSDVITSAINKIGSEFFDEFITSITEKYHEIYYDNSLNDTQKKNTFNNELNKRINNYADGEFSELLGEYLESLYKAINYKIGSSYSASDYESLVNSYKFSSDLDFQQLAEDCLYYPIFAIGGNKVENANRAVEAGNKLKEIATIYTIAYNTSGGLKRDDAKKIMIPDCKDFSSSSYEANTGVNGNHFSSGYFFTTIDKVVEVFSKLTADLVYTNYVNTTIVDYTSKWVIPMDLNNDGKFDENDITITNNGEVVEGSVSVTKLSNTEINESSDSEIKGNESENIYKIVWNLPDKFRQEDRFELSYRVKVDTEEKDFVSDYEYKANGETTITYDVIETGPTGEVVIADDVKHNIVVPTVKQKENVVIITKKDDNGNLLSGADFALTTNEKVKQVKVEYSTDGKEWTSNKEGAVFFKFSGMYDTDYKIEETTVPNGYNGNNEELSYDFNNLEGQLIEKVVINTIKKGKVKVEYVILIDGEYIPLNVYGKDEFGNVTPDFNGVDIEDVLIEDIVGKEFETEYREIPEYTFVGLYEGEINSNNKLEGKNKLVTVSEEEQTFIYVYEPPMGDGDITPPVTGIENNIHPIIEVMLFITFLGLVGYSVKKVKEEN